MHTRHVPTKGLASTEVFIALAADKLAFFVHDFGGLTCTFLLTSLRHCFLHYRSRWSPPVVLQNASNSKRVIRRRTRFRLEALVRVLHLLLNLFYFLLELIVLISLGRCLLRHDYILRMIHFQWLFLLSLEHMIFMKFWRCEFVLLLDFFSDRVICDINYDPLIIYFLCSSVAGLGH